MTKCMSSVDLNGQNIADVDSPIMINVVKEIDTSAALENFQMIYLIQLNSKFSQMFQHKFQSATYQSAEVAIERLCFN